MRILMVVRQFYPWVGGAEKQAQRLTARLIELGLDVKLVTGWWFWGTPRRERLQNIPVFRNFTCWEMFGIKGLRKFGGYLYMLSLFWYLWRHRHEYDLVHIHLLSYPAFPSVLAGRWFGKKTIIKISNSEQDSDIRRMEQSDLIPGQRQMLPLTLEADCMVAINKKIVDELTEVNVSPDRIVVIPNGVELNGTGHKTDYSFNETVTLLFVGRLHPQKGLAVLLPAFQQVLQARPDLNWRLWLLGDGLLRPELEARAGQLGIAHALKFWGKVDDVPGYLARADLFVLPSRSEGMSNALLEAMAYGLPCVATCISGNIDLIQDGQNGLLVPPGDETALANGILQLAADRALRQKVGSAAYQTVKNEYSLDRVAQKYIKLYETLLHPTPMRG